MAERYVERIIGSIHRECLNHIIIFDERHLRRVLSAYFQYHHQSTTHLSLNKDCPEPRPIQPLSASAVIAFPQMGGLHHRYEWRAANRSTRMLRATGPDPLPLASRTRHLL
jgi:hypothetical protein